jgi:hypothetical protein
MTFNATVSISDIVIMVSLIGFFSWVRFNLQRILSVVYYPTGDVRLMSFEAHDRIQKNCRDNLFAESGHSKADMTRIEEMIAVQGETLKAMSAKIDNLQRCVSALKYGADGKDLEGC